MPSFNVEFEVFCSCGEGLCRQSEVGQSRYGYKITVEPCNKCLEQAKKDGWTEGHYEGREDGRKEVEDK